MAKFLAMGFILVISQLACISMVAASDRLDVAELMMSLSIAQASEPQSCEVGRNTTQSEYSNFCLDACGQNTCQVNKFSGSVFCQCDEGIRDSIASSCSTTPPTNPSYGPDVEMCAEECHNSDLVPYFCTGEKVDRSMYCVCAPDAAMTVSNTENLTKRFRRQAELGPLSKIFALIGSLLGPLGVIVENLRLAVYELVLFLYGLI